MNVAIFRLWALFCLIVPMGSEPMQTEVQASILKARQLKVRQHRTDFLKMLTQLESLESPEALAYVLHELLSLAESKPDAYYERIHRNLRRYVALKPSEDAAARSRVLYNGQLSRLKRSYFERFETRFNPKNAPAKTRFNHLRKLAQKARSEWYKVPGACYKVSMRTAHLNHISGRDWNWQKTRIHRGHELIELQTALESGLLKPGMIIYVNTEPGKDPTSTKMEYKPHWFTYLGQDETGEPRFADQYFVEASLKRMLRFLPKRLIDTIYDPYSRLYQTPYAE